MNSDPTTTTTIAAQALMVKQLPCKHQKGVRVRPRSTNTELPLDYVSHQRARTAQWAGEKVTIYSRVAQRKSGFDVKLDGRSEVKILPREPISRNGNATVS